MNIKKNIFKNKNFKLAYYVSVMGHNVLPGMLLQRKKDRWLTLLSTEQNEALQDRLNYYNKLSRVVDISKAEGLCNLNTFAVPEKSKVYYYDLKKYLKYFDPEASFLYKPGDNIDQLALPHFVKSRPIGDSPNEILLKLNAVRHFNFIKDDIALADKKDILFGRLAVYQQNRKDFYQQYFHHPLCDLGDVAKGTDSKWLKPKVSIAEHLRYKFILALEGNDVATNLKWIMSSNSIAVMPRPKYETWYMEGRLQPDVHYICIRDDFSDVEQKLHYYATHPEAAATIVQNAHKWVRQFQDRRTEQILNLLVIQKYLRYTNQTQIL